MHFNFTWSSQVCHNSTFCILEVGVWIMSRTWHLFMKMSSYYSHILLAHFFFLSWFCHLTFFSHPVEVISIISMALCLWSLVDLEPAGTFWLLSVSLRDSENSKGNIHKFLLFRNRLTRWTNLYLWLAEAETHLCFWLLLNEINLPLWFFWVEKSLQSLHADVILCLL